MPKQLLLAAIVIAVALSSSISFALGRASDPQSADAASSSVLTWPFSFFSWLTTAALLRADRQDVPGTGN
jgi:hypothetical protein